MQEHKEFDLVKLKDGRTGSIVDKIGQDYVVDVGEKEEDFDTILVKHEEIERVLKGLATGSKKE